jgi:hypothetical protein
VKDPQVLADYIDIAALREAYRRYKTQPMADRDALTIHSTATLGLWLRRTGLAA